jgi:uncharacterized membrane protein YbhN (UPF0104 family)
VTTDDGKAITRFEAGVVLERPAPRSPARSRWWQRVVVLVGVACLVALASSLPRTDWVGSVARIGPALPLLCAVAIAWMSLYARGLGVILGGVIGWGRLVYNRFVGEAYNVVIPFGDLGGDPLRILDIGAQVGTTTAVRAIVLDRLVYASSGLVFSASSSMVAVRAFAWDPRLQQLFVGYAMVAFGAAVVVFLLATRQETGRVIQRVLGLARITLPELPAPLPIRVFARALGWNLLGRAGVLVEVGVLLRVLGQPVRLAAIVAIGALLSVAGMVFFFVPNGIGVNEGAAVFALKLTGYDEAVGLTIGVARRGRQLVLAAAGVVLSGLWRPRRGPVHPLPGPSQPIQIKQGAGSSGSGEATGPLEALNDDATRLSISAGGTGDPVQGGVGY